MKYVIFVLIFAALLLQGCGGDNKVTGQATAELEDNALRNGCETTLIVNGKNTGKVAADLILRIIPEDADKVKVTYPGSLEDTLQPGEDIGTKRVKVQGFTAYSVTKYWIKIQLINKETEEVLDEQIEWLTVSK